MRKILLAKDDMHGPRELNQITRNQNRSHRRPLLACSIRNSCACGKRTLISRPPRLLPR
jgi:hypothetical protein